MVPNKIYAWSKSSRKSRGPSALRLVLLPSAVFGVTSRLWRNKAIVSVWSPVNSLLGFHSPLLALYSHQKLRNCYEKKPLIIVFLLEGVREGDHQGRPYICNERGTTRIGPPGFTY